jgi:ubiquinone/menaquinone biosynthesis C-methylase UbiE
MTHSPWAREYERTPHEYVLGTQPSEFAHAMRELVSPGVRVLEVGCGEGRDSVFFATRGDGTRHCHSVGQFVARKARVTPP